MITNAPGANESLPGRMIDSVLRHKQLALTGAAVLGAGAYALVRTIGGGGADELDAAATAPTELVVLVGDESTAAENDSARSVGQSAVSELPGQVGVSDAWDMTEPESELAEPPTTTATTAIVAASSSVTSTTVEITTPTTTTTAETTASTTPATTEQPTTTVRPTTTTRPTTAPTTATTPTTPPTTEATTTALPPTTIAVPSTAPTTITAAEWCQQWASDEGEFILAGVTVSDSLNDRVEGNTRWAVSATGDSDFPNPIAADTTSGGSRNHWAINDSWDAERADSSGPFDVAFQASVDDIVCSGTALVRNYDGR